MSNGVICLRHRSSCKTHFLERVGALVFAVEVLDVSFPPTSSALAFFEAAVCLPDRLVGAGSSEGASASAARFL